MYNIITKLNIVFCGVIFVLLKLLTLNLHTYQEIDFSVFSNIQDFLRVYYPIQKRIADFIVKEDIDIAFFQEVGQYRYEMPDVELFGSMVKPSNYARILSNMLDEHGYENEFAWIFTHYGFGIWEEGNAIITKHKILDVEKRCVSNVNSPNDFHTRWILRVTIDVEKQLLDAYCVHFNWYEEGFEDEFKRLIQWIEEKGNRNFLIAGDFNIPSDSEYYKIIANAKVFGKKLTDCWLYCHPDNPDEPTFVGDLLSDCARIDYVLVPEHIICENAKIVFADKNARVSDHYGLFCELKFQKSR